MPERPTFTISHGDNDHFKPLDNFLLKQDIHLALDDSALYLAFEYSSLLFRTGKEKIDYFTFAPENQYFPDMKPEPGQIYSLPDIGKNPVCALDIDVEGDFIFILYSGKKLEAGILQQLFNADKAVEDIVHSYKLNVYEKNTGSFIKEVTLPKKAASFDIFNDSIYLLSTLDSGYPVLHTYTHDLLK